MNDDIQKLNDHMSHVLGRISHLEAQVESLARSVWKLQGQVELLSKKSKTFKDGSQLIESPQGFTIIDEPAPYNRENKGDLGQK